MSDLISGWKQKFFAWMMANAADHYETAMATRKAELFAPVSGKVLEIGPGAGPNLRYFKNSMRWVGLDPNPYMLPYLRSEAEALGFPIEIQAATLDTLDCPMASFDYVVSTLVLCSVTDLDQTLRQIYALLKPGGQFLFIEHVAAPNGSLLRQVQDGVRPIWQWIGDGCQSNRQIARAIDAVGFTSVTYEAFDGPIPIPIVRPHICGVATK